MSKVVELNFPQIAVDNGVSYGGNQEWFAREINRKAGCASVCGANMAAYYAANVSSLAPLYPGGADRFPKEEFLDTMEKMCDYIPPNPMMGVPYLARFVDRFLLYAKDRQVELAPRYLRGCASWEEGFGFVKEAIDAGHPLAMLILRHSDPEFYMDTWHWVTITGYVQDPIAPKVIYSNFGRREIHSADRLFCAGADNIIYMVWFDAGGNPYDRSN